jgi:hypothetical protein
VRITILQEAAAMKSVRAFIPLLAVLLLLAGCAGQAATTTTSPPTSGAPVSSLPSSSTSSSSTSSSSPLTTLAPTTSTADSTSTAEAATPPATAPKTFTAQLTGAEVVPAVTTSATGSATFTVDPTGTRVHFVLEVSNISDVTASRLHEGKPGTNGSGVLILYPGPTQEGPFSGVLAGGNFNASALIGSLSGKTIADFVALLESGQAYVNVGTTTNPAGEIRGQVH